MKIRVARGLLFVLLAVPVLHAQTTEESVDSSETTATTEVTATSTTSTSITTTTTSTSDPAAPGWVHMVRIAALAGPFAFLLLAWLVGGYMHVRIVHREQEQFPVLRGTRAPQWVPMTISGLLFFLPAVLFIAFEIRSRMELSRGIGGVVDEWQPVTERAWLLLVICLVLALVPWLFARRADAVS